MVNRRASILVLLAFGCHVQNRQSFDVQQNSIKRQVGPQTGFNITNGARTSGQSTVGLLVSIVPNQGANPTKAPIACTGSLLCSNVVLSAAHCLGKTETDANLYVSAFSNAASVESKTSFVNSKKVTARFKGDWLKNNDLKREDISILSSDKDLGVREDSFYAEDFFLLATKQEVEAETNANISDRQIFANMCGYGVDEAFPRPNPTHLYKQIGTARIAAMIADTDVNKGGGLTVKPFTEDNRPSNGHKVGQLIARGDSGGPLYTVLKTQLGVAQAANATEAYYAPIFPKEEQIIDAKNKYCLAVPSVYEDDNQFFRLRCKVKINNAQDAAIVEFWGNNARPMFSGAIDSRKFDIKLSAVEATAPSIPLAAPVKATVDMKKTDASVTKELPIDVFGPLGVNTKVFTATVSNKDILTVNEQRIRVSCSVTVAGQEPDPSPTSEVPTETPTETPELIPPSGALTPTPSEVPTMLATPTPSESVVEDEVTFFDGILDPVWDFLGL